jgi:Sigma-70, region 4
VQPSRAGHEDDILASLTDLVVAADELRRRLSVLLDRAPLNNLRGTGGLSYGQIMPLNKRLQVIELISEAFKTLTEAGGRFRQAEVRALYDEGMTMDEIAAVLGVTRQRVSALLRQVPRPSQRRRQRSPGLPPGGPSADRQLVTPGWQVPSAESGGETP